MANLIFNFDGTCNDPEDVGHFSDDMSITNVLKLHAFFGGKLTPNNASNENTPGQHSFYYSGVGTRGNWIWRIINSAIPSPYGEINDIIGEADTDLEAHYKPGDKIYVFGFSRGAAIARIFAARCPVDIEFIGVFDTVAATRGELDLSSSTLPASGIVFENGSIAKHINRALHLVALDEKRVPFQPTLFNKEPRISEVWFAGTHSDIGGNHWFDGLSDITLQFMLDAVASELQVLTREQISFESLAVASDQDQICWDDLNIKPLVNGVIHDTSASGLHAHVRAPRFVRVNMNDWPSRNLPIIHHSVKQRFNTVTGYRPYALRNREFLIMQADGSVDKNAVCFGLADL